MTHLSLRTLLAFSLLAPLLSLRPETLVGSSHAGGRVNRIQFGDNALDDVLGAGYSFDAFGSTPINENVDTIISAGYGRASGKPAGVAVDYTTTTIGTEFRWQLRPKEAINPYLIGGPFVKRWKVDVDSSKDAFLRGLDQSENIAGVGLGGGSEFEIYDTFLAFAELNVRVSSDLDVTAIGQGSIGWWALPQLLGSVGLSYDTDEGDSQISLIATWKLP